MNVPENFSQNVSTAALSAALYDMKHLCDTDYLLVIANAKLSGRLKRRVFAKAKQVPL